MSVQLKPEELDEVRTYCRAVVPDARVLVYGSRARGTAKNTSDLDLALDAGAPVPADKVLQLQNLFACSYLPFRVDVVDLNTVTDDFRAHILKHGVGLFTCA